MQIISVLRGCLAAYGTGVAIAIAEGLWAHIQDGHSGLGMTAVIYLSIIFGGMFAMATTILVVLIWYVLALSKKTVSFIIALITAICVSTLGIWILSGDGPQLLYSIPLGLIFGGVFWLAAFGRRRRVQLSLW